MLQKYSVTLRGHRTSYSLEPQFQAELTRIAHQKGLSAAAQINHIDAQREPDENLSSAIRLFVLAHLRARATD